jgi:metallo-beta-lactamase family protein
VANLEGLSGHADYSEILDWLKGFDRAPRKVFITHGEAAAADALRLHIEESLGWPVCVPDYLEKSVVP